jgi:GNAT superfamily N-acetyltransferase
MTISYQPIGENQFDTLVQAFNAGYEGYIVPVQFGAEQMEAHIDRYDIDLSASRLAYDGEQPIGVALLGVRGRRGWVGGVGVSPAYRGKGVGRGLMENLIESARVLRLEQLQLEVIEGNTTAYDLYRKLGFKPVNHLLILERVAAAKRALPTQRVSGTGVEIQEMSAEDALAYYSAFHTRPNPWQREEESLQKLAPKMTGWAARKDEHILAYGIGVAHPQTINWMEMAVIPGEGNALRALVAKVHSDHPNALGRFVNLGEDDPAWGALLGLGYEQTMAQSEMWLML